MLKGVSRKEMGEKKQGTGIINMSCGQTALYPSCLSALGMQLETPLYYPSYWALEAETITMLKTLLNTRGDILLITGSGTYGIEAVMTSALEPGEKVLTVNTGIFGQVLTEVAQITGACPKEIWIARGKSVTPEQIRRRLADDPQIKMVAVVFVETSMGTVNPVGDIGELLRDFPDVLFMVDAISAVGATEVRMDEWGIDFCCTSSQKSLSAPQGVAIVAVGERGWRKIAARKRPIPSLCLDLNVWRAYHQAVERSLTGVGGEDVSLIRFKAIHGPSPSYALIRALHASLKETMAEGLEKVFQRHYVTAKAIREAVRAMGFKVLADEGVAAPNCTVILLPGRSCEVRQICDRLLEEHGIAIALGSVNEEALGYVGIRVGNMGFVADPKYVLALIMALESTLASFGYEVQVGAGVQAAQRVLY